MLLTLKFMDTSKHWVKVNHVKDRSPLAWPWQTTVWSGDRESNLSKWQQSTNHKPKSINHKAFKNSWSTACVTLITLNRVINLYLFNFVSEITNKSIAPILVQRCLHGCSTRPVASFNMRGGQRKKKVDRARANFANWGEPERAPHWSNGVPRDLYLFVSYVIP